MINELARMPKTVAPKPLQEAAMSTISIYPQAASQAGKAPRMERISSAPFSDDRPERHSDADMMYAWSIGVTTAARTMGAQREETQHAECPPEVYIG